MIAPSIYKCKENIASIGDFDTNEDFIPIGIDIFGCGVISVCFWADNCGGCAYLDQANVLYGPEVPLPVLLTPSRRRRF